MIEITSVELTNVCGGGKVSCTAAWGSAAAFGAVSWVAGVGMAMVANYYFC